MFVLSNEYFLPGYYISIDGNRMGVDGDGNICWRMEYIAWAKTVSQNLPILQDYRNAFSLTILVYIGKTILLKVN